MSTNLWNVVYNPNKDQYELFFRDQYVTDYIDETVATDMAYRLGMAYDTGYRKALEVVMNGGDAQELLARLDQPVYTEEF